MPTAAELWDTLENLPRPTLGELFSAVGETGINLEDLRLEHSLGRRVGLAEISVDPNRRDELVEALEQRGWKVVQ